MSKQKRIGATTVAPIFFGEADDAMSELFAIFSISSVVDKRENECWI